MKTIRRIAPRVVSVVVATAAALSLATLTAPAAQAEPRPDPVEEEAVRIMQLSYPDFLDVKESEPPPFNWHDDGCSAWGQLGVFSLVFDGPCKQHDFGYRNFGRGGLALSPNEDVRAWIDDRLQKEMQRACDSKFGSLWATQIKNECYAEAEGTWRAVRLLGGGSFDG
jgi:hypothetical protein